MVRVMDITDGLKKLGSVVAGGTRVAMALSGSVLISALLAACSGSDSGSAASEVPRVGLMHVGTDHVPPSFPALANELRDEFGWDVPQGEVDRCADVTKILKSCDIRGKDVGLLWRNLEPFEADTQAYGVRPPGRRRDRRLRGRIDQSRAGRRPTGCRTRHPSSFSTPSIRSATA